MSENYIYAIEVGENEVPIKLNHMLTGNVMLGTDNGLIEVFNGDNYYFIVDPNGGYGEMDYSWYSCLSDGKGQGIVGVNSDSSVLLRYTDGYVSEQITVADDGIWMDASDKDKGFVFSSNCSSYSFLLSNKSYRTKCNMYVESNDDYQYSFHLESSDKNTSSSIKMTPNEVEVTSTVGSIGGDDVYISWDDAGSNELTLLADTLSLESSPMCLSVDSDGIIIKSGTSTVFECTSRNTSVYSTYFSAGSVTISDFLDIVGDCTVEGDALFECDVTTHGTIMVNTLSARYDTEDTQDGPEYHTLPILSPVSVPAITVEGSASFGSNVTVNGKVKSRKIEGLSDSHDSSSNLYIKDKSEVLIGDYVTLQYGEDNLISRGDPISEGLYYVELSNNSKYSSMLITVLPSPRGRTIYMIPGVSDCAIMHVAASSNAGISAFKLLALTEDDRDPMEVAMDGDYHEYDLFDSMGVTGRSICVERVVKLFGLDYTVSSVVVG